jgi:hypothetical protein
MMMMMMMMVLMMMTLRIWVMTAATTSLNAQHYGKIHTALAEFRNHDILGECFHHRKLEIKDGAHEAPFKQADFKAKMDKDLTKDRWYRCGFNLFALNFGEPDAAIGTRISMKKINMLIDHNFTQPAPSPLDINVGLNNGENPNDLFGQLSLCSPPEIAHAIVMAIERDRILPDNEEIMKSWVKVIKSSPIKFQMIENIDARHFNCVQFRLDMSAANAALRQTQLMSIMDVCSFADRKSLICKMTVPQIAAAYRENLEYGKEVPMEDRASADRFVANAMAINAHILKNDAIREILFEADDRSEPNPFDNAAKLVLFKEKAKTPENIEWAFKMCWDFIKSGGLAVDQVGVRALEGKTTGSNGKGLIDLFVYKKECKQYIVNDVIPTIGWPSSVKEAMIKSVDTIKEFRDKNGYLYNPTFVKAKLGWRADWLGFSHPKGAQGS